MSYFVGHKAVKDGHKEDAGFAINGGKGWADVVFDNHQIEVNGNTAIAMGNYYFTSCADGSKTKVRIFLHHSSVPYSLPPAAPTAKISVEQVKSVQAAWANAIKSISRTYLQRGDYVAAAAKAAGELYGYGHTNVLFKPTKAAEAPFRPTGADAMSYFVQPAVMARAVELYKNLPMGEDEGSEKRAPRSAGAMAIPDAPLPTIALTGGPSSGASVPVGSAGVTFTATDAAGNTAIRSFSVQVNDNDPPTLEVEDVDVNSCTPTVVTFSPAAADNCPGATAACSPSSGSEFPVGETEVTCTAVDAAGKTTQESFVVLVKCDGHGYYKKSHGNNIRKRRNPHMKKWLHYWDQYRR
ncbi:unnamed protein product [Symbiodinium sp. KB8]|nr:unnamed protein product [Symbiodinium sp. KB8]